MAVEPDKVADWARESETRSDSMADAAMLASISILPFFRKALVKMFIGYFFRVSGKSSKLGNSPETRNKWAKNKGVVYEQTTPLDPKKPD